jgi:LPXTG-site transpeptidase (sortase) family protein
MMDKSFRLLLAGVLVSMVGVGGAAVTVGYIEQSQISLNLSAPNVVKCDRAATIKVRVVSRDSGKPIKKQVVEWRITGSRSSGDGLSAASTVTNSKGRTSIRLTFGPVAGRRTVTASAANTSPSITVRCAGGLPATSVLPPDDHVAAPSSVLLRPNGADAVSLVDTLPVRRLRLERLGIGLPIIEGDGFTVPEGAASHYPDTAWPGEGSNTYIYAHAREGNFLELWRVRSGDVVEIDMSDGSVATYRVSEILPVVPWDALEHLLPTTSERLTLQTSLWYDDTAPRFIVIAERVPGA